MPTYRALLKDAEAALTAAPHPERAARDAEALLLHLVAQNRSWLFTHSDDPTSPEAEAAYQALLARRAAGEPLQYITGSAEFFGLPFSVGPGVLIPRPETEHLVEEVLRLAQQMQANPLLIADIGTGSGIIAVALAHALLHAELDAQIETQIDAVDLSPQALHIARANAARNHVSSRIHFHQGDLLVPLAGQRFHIIASNPPYIPSSDHDSLAIEVRNHEPHTALFAGEDGLSIYRRLIPAAREHLHPGGWLVLEIGFGQQEPLSSLLKEHGYLSIDFRNDYQQIPRVAIAMCP